MMEWGQCVRGGGGREVNYGMLGKLGRKFIKLIFL